MTMTRSILEIVSFLVHFMVDFAHVYFHKESSKSYVSIMQSELPIVNLLFMFFH